MSDRVQLPLLDIVESITKISNYLEGVSYDTFKQSSLLQDAIIRNLEIIGEAVKRVPTSFLQDEPTIRWNDLIGMRNILTHQYHRVDQDIVWHTSTIILPEVLEATNRLLNKR